MCRGRRLLAYAACLRFRFLTIRGIVVHSRWRVPRPTNYGLTPTITQVCLSSDDDTIVQNTGPSHLSSSISSTTHATNTSPRCGNKSEISSARASASATASSSLLSLVILRDLPSIAPRSLDIAPLPLLSHRQHT